MDGERVRTSDEERLAVLALWAIPGMGPKSLESLLASSGPFAQLLDVAPLEWAGAFRLTEEVLARLSEFPTLRQIGERVASRVRGRMKVAYREDPQYPEQLRGVAGAPPLLFYVGNPSVGGRRVALVGSRQPDQGFLSRASNFAEEVARGGLGVVSGGAYGIDRACHLGALQASGETWAFLGSALDCIDAAQAELLGPMLDGGGTFFSELPPGVRASRKQFPRRNRLVSGASDAVVILRAGTRSGCYYTALAALEQGRALLAIPGESDNEYAAMCNRYIQQGVAKACLNPADVWEAMNLKPEVTARRKRVVDMSTLSEDARIAYELVPRAAVDFEQVLGKGILPAARLTSALCELELEGLVLQRPGRQYERI